MQPCLITFLAAISRDVVRSSAPLPLGIVPHGMLPTINQIFFESILIQNKNNGRLYRMKGAGPDLLVACSSNLFLQRPCSTKLCSFYELAGDCNVLNLQTLRMKLCSNAGGESGASFNHMAMHVQTSVPSHPTSSSLETSTGFIRLLCHAQAERCSKAGRRQSTAMLKTPTSKKVLV
jgi:hypothetical protein